MKKIPSVVLAALAVIGSLLVVRECGRREGARTALAAQRDAKTDTLIVEVGVAYRDTLAQAKREIARLKQRIAGGRPATLKPPSTNGADSVSLAADEAASAPLLLRDSLIAVQDRTILFLTHQVSIRDTLIAQIQMARNAWRTASTCHMLGIGWMPRCPSRTVAFIAGGVTVGAVMLVTR